MEFNNYKFADISSNDNSKISELENSLNSQSNNKIVLIAYECTNKNEE